MEMGVYMIFEQNNLNFQLLDVLYFDNSEVLMHTQARSFCALSLRIDSEATIDFRNKRIHLTSRDLTFFPSDFGYIRRSKRDKMIVFHFYLSNYVSFEPEILHDFKFEKLLPLFEEALQIWNEKNPGYRFRVNAILYTIFAETCIDFASKDRVITPVISSALSYINENYSDSTLNIESIAAYTHVSSSYLRRVFNRDIGISPKQYITDLRFEHAKSLLNAGYDTVASVAEKTGFCDTKNFSTAFKKRYGYPPSKQSYSFG